MSENILLRAGDKFRLGRTAYEVQNEADIDAVLIVNDGEKDGIRQVLYTCPKGCISKGTNKVWKMRCSRKQHATDPAKCPMCGAEVTAGTPNADKKPEPKPEPQGESQNEQDPEAGKPEDGQEAMEQEAKQPQPEPKKRGKGKQAAEADLKDALEQAKEHIAHGGDESADAKPPKGKGKGKGKAKPAPEAPPTILETLEEMAESLMTMTDPKVEAEPEPVAPTPEPPPPAKPSIRKCFNCEHPTDLAPGKGDLTLCKVCEDMREHILDCLTD